MDFLTFLLAVASAVGAVFLKLAISEFQDWMPTIARRLVDRAVSLLPYDQQERYREEWYAHIDHCPGKLGKLWHALGCMKGTVVERIKSKHAKPTIKLNNENNAPTERQKIERNSARIASDYAALIEAAAKAHDNGHAKLGRARVYYIDGGVQLLGDPHFDIKPSNVVVNAAPASRRPNPRSRSRPT